MAARSRRFTVGTNGVYTTLDEFMAGQVVHFAGTGSIPSGYLECNGAAVSRTTYGTLFAAIGSTYGPGDGATTFNVPDLRGEFVRGADRGRGVDSGRAIGSAQVEGLKAHTHATNSAGDSGNVNYGNDSTALPRNAVTPTGTTSGAMTGTTGATETRPRNVALVACIKYS